MRSAADRAAIDRVAIAYLKTAKDVRINKPVRAYHGSWQQIAKLVPRQVKALASIGTWVTFSKTNAKLYGSTVYEVQVPPGRYMNAHTDDFDLFFFNVPLVKKHFPNADEMVVERFDNPKDRWWRDEFRSAYRNPAYLKGFRDMLAGSGYNGIIWTRSRIDLQSGDDPHTVMVLFDHKPMQAVEVTSKQGSKDSLHGLVKGFMTRLADELKKKWGGGGAGLLKRKGASLSEAPWVIGVTVSDEAKASRVYDRIVAIHLDRESPSFTIFQHSVDRRGPPKQVTAGGFSMEMSSPASAAQSIAKQWESASYGY